MPYGPRKDQSGNSNNSQPEARHQSFSASPLSICTYFLDRAAQWQVPHAYFTQFYIVSVVSSAFWATQLALGGPAFRAVSCLVRNREGAAGMAPTQVWFCWLLLAVQGTRRLGECIALARAAGKSRAMMWVTHWAIGIAFYAAMGVAVWVEGSGTGRLMFAGRGSDSVQIRCAIQPVDRLVHGARSHLRYMQCLSARFSSRQASSQTITAICRRCASTACRGTVHLLWW